MDPSDYTQEARPQGKDSDHTRLLSSRPESPGDLDTVLQPTPSRASAAAAPRGRWTGKVCGRHQVLDLLGSGGMGEVYRAHDPTLKRDAALKVLHEDDPKVILRFLQEARLQARLEHPNICKIYEAGEVEGKPYIVMQLIEGRTLKDAAPEMPLDHRIKVVSDIAEAVHAAHRLGLIHRDLKPGNIMVEAAEEGPRKAYVLDFGLAQDLGAPGITTMGVPVGTPSYMAPEQAEGRIGGVDRRTDVYGLGATLYHVLGHQPPFEGSNAMEVILKVIHAEPLPLRQVVPSLPADLETIVMKCLEKQPQDRYDSARALAEDLNRYLEGEPILARRASLAFRLRKRAKKHRALVVVSTLALAAVAFFTVLGLQASLNAARRAQMAQRLGLEIKELESALRIAHLLPQHDISRETAGVRARMVKLEGDIPSLPKGTWGPALYALGRAHMALRDYEPAEKYLERAWQGEQDHRPEVAYALGLCLTRLYQKEWGASSRIPNMEARKARREEIDLRLRRPAQNYLRLSRSGSAEPTTFVESILALLNNDYPGAVLRTREAFDQNPWLYEAIILQGEVHLAEGLECEERGDYPLAETALSKAGEAFVQAGQIARSDPEVHLDNAQRLSHQLNLAMRRGEFPEELFLSAGAACDTALAIEPSSSKGYRSKAELYLLRGNFNNRHTNVDPEGDYQTARHWAELALAQNPKDVEALTTMGNAYGWSGKGASMRGRDPGGHLHQSTVYLQRAHDLEPASVPILHGLGLTLLWMGDWEQSHGRDPSDSYRQALQHLDQAYRVSPRDIAILNLAGNLCSGLARVQAGRGEDASTLYHQSIEWFQKCLGVNPNYPAGWISLGGTQCAFATFQLNRGTDPRPMFAEAIASCERSVQLDPRTGNAHLNLGATTQLLAEYEMAHGKNPMPLLRRTEGSYREVVRLQAGYAPAHVNLAQALADQAYFGMRTGVDPRPLLNQALRGARESLRLNPEFEDGFYTTADVLNLWAAYALHRGEDPSHHLKEAREVLNRGLRANPASFDCYASLGRTEVLAARWSARKNLRPDAAMKAAILAFEAALKQNEKGLPAWLGLAEAHRRLGEWKVTRNEPIDPELTASQAAVDQLLAQAPSLPAGRVAQAALGVLKASAASNARQRKTFQAELEQAFQLNPLLKWDAD